MSNLSSSLCRWPRSGLRSLACATLAREPPPCTPGAAPALHILNVHHSRTGAPPCTPACATLAREPPPCTPGAAPALHILNVHHSRTGAPPCTPVCATLAREPPPRTPSLEMCSVSNEVCRISPYHAPLPHESSILAPETPGNGSLRIPEHGRVASTNSLKLLLFPGHAPRSHGSARELPTVHHWVLLVLPWVLLGLEALLGSWPSPGLASNCLACF